MEKGLIAIAAAALGFGLGYLVMEGDILLSVIFAIIFFLLGGGISALLITRKLKKRVSLQYGAKDYVRPGSFNLSYSKDIYLYSETSKRAKPKDNRK